MKSQTQTDTDERRRFNQAVENFMDLLARLIAREHLRQSSLGPADEREGDEPKRAKSKSRTKKQKE